MNKRLPLVVGSLLAACVVGGWAATVQAEPAVLDVVQKQAAKISENERMHLTRPQNPRFEVSDPFEDLQDPASGDEVWVEKGTHQVRYYSSAKAYGRQLQDAGSEKILAAAERQVTRTYNSSRLAGMTRTIQREVGGEELSYVVEYREQIDGIPTFNMVRMTFMPDGTMANYLVEDTDVTVSLTPHVTREDAIATAGEKSGFQRWASESANLVVTRGAADDQHLAWSVDLRTGDANTGAKFWALVDALDGAVIDWGLAD